jgi:hypothetical protein
VLDDPVQVLYLDLVLAGDSMDGVHLPVEGAGQDPDHVRVFESHQGHPVLKMCGHNLAPLIFYL